MIEHDDLKRELKKAQKRAKEAERKLDDLAIAAELIEEESSSTIAFKHDIVEPALEGLDLTELVKAVAEADVDSLLTAHGNLRSNAISLARWADDLLDSEDEQDSETDTSKDSSSDEIARQANDHLERRLRDLVYDLYEQALALPREMRLLYRKFSKERDNFQTQAREYEDVVHSLLHDQKIDARLSIVFTRVKRTYPAMDVDDVAQLNEILTQVRNAELKLDDIEKNLSLINSVILEQRCSYQDLANQVMNLRARADDIESLATMFGIPCPVEIARQIEETRARLLTLGGEDQSERLRSMMR